MKAKQHTHTALNEKVSLFKRMHFQDVNIPPPPNLNPPPNLKTIFNVAKLKPKKIQTQKRILKN